MGIRQKFYVLAGIIGALLAVISVIGFYTADTNLERAVEQELTATMGDAASQMDGWLQAKGNSAQHVADLLTEFNGDETRTKSIASLAIGASDKEILDINVGMEDGYFASYRTQNKSTGTLDPRTRPWYNDGKQAGKMVFTDPYVDKNTGKLVVSAVAPFKKDGQFAGTICTDIDLAVVDAQVDKLKYHGEAGMAAVADKNGMILGIGTDEAIGSKFQDLPGVGNHFDEMLEKGKGVFVFDSPRDGKMICGYTVVPSTGWLLAMSVPYDYVFSSVTTLKTVYGILTIVGLILVLVTCFQFAGRITRPLVALEAHAAEMAKGNLAMPPLSVESRDEIGSLTQAFNTMNENLRNLITHMATTAEQVAASSEELTANAQQSADTAVHVAENVGEVSAQVAQQLDEVDKAKQSVDGVYHDIDVMSEKAVQVTVASTHTAEAAKRGASLMEEAISKMGSIEKSVMESAAVVKALGENSQQIGQIVEAISAIAQQTNLLSLNAAIEAARAGEQGRGFAVVAEEVRKLAAESQESAEQIKERISSIQKDTAQAVESMQNGTQEVTKGTKAIRDVGEQFEDIMAKVDDINQQMSQINESVSKVSAGAEQIVTAVDAIDGVSKKTAENTQTISSATEEQSASNEEIAAASQALSTLAGNMQNAVNKFKT
ncbi:MAG: methyl-accepting chemotaxis protein [Selenomonas sp.]|uniref:methyl-accepting chemotaxis protein n=1 Tax=Selenomonas sp. TaxID=2053611 RepID=UPI0025D10060|nr:methyl-accepting chemotaxis protein [Selenomonas sp.]MCR5438357.1 methyl-accepting chemotaxis protein [Selenomonas sp.]